MNHCRFGQWMVDVDNDRIRTRDKQWKTLPHGGGRFVQALVRAPRPVDTKLLATSCCDSDDPTVIHGIVRALKTILSTEYTNYFGNARGAYFFIRGGSPAHADDDRLALTASTVRGELEFLYADFAREGGLIVVSAPTVYKYLNRSEARYLARQRERQHLVVPLKAGPRGVSAIVRSQAQYTGVGEALGACAIHSLLEQHGLGRAVRVVDLRAAQVASDHMVLLGGWMSNVLSCNIVDLKDHNKYREFDRRIPYRLRDGYVFRRHDTTGRESVYLTPEYDIIDGELVPITEYALITKVKEPFNGKTVIVAAGVNSQGTHAASRLLSLQADVLREYLRGAFRRQIPDCFQVIVRVPVSLEGPGLHVELFGARELS